MSKTQPDCFQLRSNRYSLTTIQLLQSSADLFNEQLEKRIAQAPGFFKQLPVVLDINAAPQISSQTLFSCIDSVKRHNLSLLAIQSGVEEHRAVTKDCGVALLPGGSASPIPTSTSTDKEQTSQQATSALPSSNTAEEIDTLVAEPAIQTVTAQTEQVAPPLPRVYRQVVRSGQQLYSPSDLVIFGAVSPGAEVLAEGNIHIYGPLRGRALAGVNGHTKAFIFCDTLDAELISIAGHYQLNEDIPLDFKNERVAIHLEDEKLKFASLKA